MSEIRDRVRAIRKDAGLTQHEFAQRAGISYSTLAGYEAGTRQPVSAAISAISKTFGVNPDWLRDGVGAMYADDKEDTDLRAWVDDAIGDRMDSGFKLRLLRALSQLHDDEWAMLERLARQLAEEQTEQSISAQHVSALYAAQGDDAGELDRESGS